MSAKQPTGPQSPPASGDKNQGEGNREAARRFNQAEQQFVQSPRGRERIKKAGDVAPSEVPELERAERAGKSHARNDDSRGSPRPDAGREADGGDEGLDADAGDQPG
jgi:hypothetical protein